MLLILGNVLSEKKPIFLSLTSIYGIGISLSKKILNELFINPLIKTKNLIYSDFIKIKNLLESKKYLIEGDLKKFKKDNIQRLVDINSYKGKRFKKGLPVNGQRTRTNAKTSRKLTFFKINLKNNTNIKKIDNKFKKK
jgi:small subunit ribosomal protein S13